MTAFRRVDWILLFIATVLRLGDTAVTRWGLAHGGVESNPILGPHPSLAWNLAYLAATMILLWIVAWWLGGKWRIAWIAGYALVEAWSITCWFWIVVCWTRLL